MKKKTIIMSITVAPPESFNRRVLTRFDVGYNVLYDSFPKPPHQRLAKVLSIQHVLKKGWLNHQKYVWDLYYVTMRIGDGQPGAGKTFTEKHIPADNVTNVWTEDLSLVSKHLAALGVLNYQK
ncbi:MAG: hypothetical protein JRN62_03525 [Nitrososphaerota archaeon]|jgi:hypothetical protein|nr:hypothetical protein [Nitrososphaerota archaeon]